jgi:hypothetical protein
VLALVKFVKRIKAAAAWWTFFATLGLLPTLGVVVAVLKDVMPWDIMLLYVMAAAAYWVVLVTEAEPYLEAIKPKDRPRVELDEIRGAELTGAGVPNGYFVLQLWFKNRPATPSEKSVAREVTAFVEITSQDTGARVSFHGQWARSTAPDHVGYQGFATSVDILPNNLSAKLNVALKYRQEPFAFAFALENFHASVAGKHLPYAIVKGKHQVKVSLKGIGVSEEFLFTLENLGEGTDPSLSREPSRRLEAARWRF